MSNLSKMNNQNLAYKEILFEVINVMCFKKIVIVKKHSPQH